MSPAVRTGLDLLLDTVPAALHGARVGLLTNPTAITGGLNHAIDAIASLDSLSLVALFGPEHGVRGEAQAGEHVRSGHDERTGLPVHSLYGPTRTPTAEMLAGIDALIVDLQDIAVRYATYASSLFAVMAVAAGCGVEVVILDRPNPLNGVTIQGNVLRPDVRSFVGGHSVPIRHGLTLGEQARLYAHDRTLPEPRVVAMQGWRRAMWYDDTGLPWVLPSPNLPTLDSLTLYPATCLVEGTNLSEGRGTTKPFELIGAPWVEPDALARRLRQLDVPGAAFRPCYFVPTFAKHAGERCGGVQVHVTDREVLDTPTLGVHLLASLRALDPNRFAWVPPSDEKHPFFIDLLAGTADLRHTVDAGGPLSDLTDAWSAEAASFQPRFESVALYS